MNYFTKKLDLKTSQEYNCFLEIKEVTGTGTLNAVSFYNSSDTSVTNNQGQFIDSFSSSFTNLEAGKTYNSLITTRNSFENTDVSLRTFASFAVGQSGSVTFRLSLIENTSLTAENFVYEPYQATTTQIALPEGQFAAKISDTIKDQFRIAYNESDGNYHLYLDKNVGKVVLDGSDDENWKLDTISPGTDIRQFSVLFGGIDTNNSGLLPTLFSDYFQGVIWNNSWLKNNTVTPYKYGNSSGLRLYSNQFEDVNALKAWLSTHNTIVYYQFETPQTIDIGKVQMPLTYYPITNVSTDCPLLPIIEVAYYRDFKTTIETMQEDIASNTSRIETLEEQLQSQATTISNLENRVTALEPTQTESEVVEQ